MRSFMISLFLALNIIGLVARATENNKELFYTLKNNFDSANLPTIDTLKTIKIGISRIEGICSALNKDENSYESYKAFLVFDKNIVDQGPLANKRLNSRFTLGPWGWEDDFVNSNHKYSRFLI